MKDIDLPERFNIAFASDQVAPYIRDVPDAPSGVAGSASLQLGFPGPDCFTPLTAGGTPPFGQDFNGLLKKVTEWNRWQAAGGPVFYDAGFSTSISGYPKGALLASSSVDGLVWRCLTDDNATNPDDPATTANWAPFSRVVLAAALVLYVSITGNDATGNGTMAFPYRTVQKAINTLVTYYDWAGHAVSITRMDSGTAYTDSATVSGRFVGQTGPLTITASSSANVTVSCATSEVYKIDAGAFAQVMNQKIANSVGNGLYSTRGSSLLHSGMDYGVVNGSHILTDRVSIALQNGNNNISGGASSHASASGSSVNELGSAINFSVAAIPFSAFVAAATANIQTIGVSFTGNSGSVTGKKFVSDLLAMINTGTGNINFLPGNAAGDQTNGGRYN